MWLWPVLVHQPASWCLWQILNVGFSHVDVDNLCCVSPVYTSFNGLQDHNSSRRGRLKILFSCQVFIWVQHCMIDACRVKLCTKCVPWLCHVFKVGNWCISIVLASTEIPVFALFFCQYDGLKEIFKVFSDDNLNWTSQVFISSSNLNLFLRSQFRWKNQNEICIFKWVDRLFANKSWKNPVDFFFGGVGWGGGCISHCLRKISEAQYGLGKTLAVFFAMNF